jgi:hypothetical protein
MEYIITTRKGNLTNEHGAQTAETNQQFNMFFQPTWGLKRLK